MNIPKLILKYSCRIAGIIPEISVAISITYSVWFSLGLPGNCRITSGTDDAPGRLDDSLHKKGKAFDLGIWEIPPIIQNGLKIDLETSLGPEFDVVLEKDHIHIEFDPPEKPKQESENE